MTYKTRSNYKMGMCLPNCEGRCCEAKRAYNEALDAVLDEINKDHTLDSLTRAIKELRIK